MQLNVGPKYYNIKIKDAKEYKIKTWKLCSIKVNWLFKNLYELLYFEEGQARIGTPSKENYRWKPDWKNYYHWRCHKSWLCIQTEPSKSRKFYWPWQHPDTISLRETINTGGFYTVFGAKDAGNRILRSEQTLTAMRTFPPPKKSRTDRKPSNNNINQNPTTKLLPQQGRTLLSKEDPQRGKLHCCSKAYQIKD